MRVLSDLSDRLATELAAKGLEAGSARWEEEDSAQTRLLAKWSIDSQSVLQVRVYVADYFGSHPFWVGFGSEDRRAVKTILDRLDASSFTELRWSDWTEGFDLVDGRKSRSLRRTSYTVYEDYRAQGYWVWFGRYFEAGQEEGDHVLDFLRTVIELTRMDMPADGPTEAVIPKKVRLQQNKFRRALIRRHGESCALTGCRIGLVLEAAHINSWAENETSRLSPDNGLLLLSTVHRLFDRGIISFEDSGCLRIKGLADKRELRRLNLHEGVFLRHKLTDGQKRNLQIHRKRTGYLPESREGNAK